MLTYARRQQLWDFCRDLIDREVIYRADDTHPEIPGKAPNSTYVWQFYLRRATYNPHFAHALGLLFWDQFRPVYLQAAFQICACHPSGPPIAAAIQAVALRDHGLSVNVFHARREPKAFGVDNWFDGRVTADPVLMVDDVAASAPYMAQAAARVRQKLKLPLHYQYFTVVNKVGRGVPKEAQHTDSYLDGQLISLFNLNNFHLRAAAYRERYGQRPNWSGLVK
jgi:hypothetical protein